MENLTPPGGGDKPQSQSSDHVPAALVREQIAVGVALARGMVNFLSWAATAASAVWIWSRLATGGTNALDIVAIVILLTLERRRR